MSRFFSSLCLVLFGLFWATAVSAAPAPLFRLVAPEGQGVGQDTFYQGRCFRIDIMLDTGGIDTNGADVEIAYDNTVLEFVRSDCQTPADTVYSDGLFDVYPGAGNEITDDRLYLSAYNNPGSSTNVANERYGYVYAKVLAAPGAHTLPFVYVFGNTTDTNLAQTNGNGTDILQSVEDLQIQLLPDTDNPVIAPISPAHQGASIAVDSGISFLLTDQMAGIDQTSVDAVMQINGAQSTNQAVTLSQELRTNQNRTYSYRGAFVPTHIDMLAPGVFPYDATIEIQLDVDDLGAPDVHHTTYQWTFQTESDTDAPFVRNRQPAAQATGISGDTNIQFELVDFRAGGTTPGSGIDDETVALQIISGRGAENLTCADDALNCVFVSSHILAVTWSSVESFDQPEEVQVRVQATDVSGNAMDQATWSFMTADPDAPYLSDFDPEPNSAGHTAQTPIQFVVHDDGTGVDITTLEVWVGDERYTIDDDALQFQGTSAAYSISITPEEPWPSDQAVVVRVRVADLSDPKNYTAPDPYLYSFIVGTFDAEAEPLVCPELACPVVSAPQCGGGGGGVVIINRCESSSSAQESTTGQSSSQVSDEELQCPERRNVIRIRRMYIPVATEEGDTLVRLDDPVIQSTDYAQETSAQIAPTIKQQPQDLASLCAPYISTNEPVLAPKVETQEDVRVWYPVIETIQGEPLFDDEQIITVPRTDQEMRIQGKIILESGKSFPSTLTLRMYDPLIPYAQQSPLVFETALTPEGEWSLALGNVFAPKQYVFFGEEQTWQGTTEEVLLGGVYIEPQQFETMPGSTTTQETVNQPQLGLQESSFGEKKQKNTWLIVLVGVILILGVFSVLQVVLIGSEYLSLISFGLIMLIALCVFFIELLGGTLPSWMRNVQQPIVSTVESIPFYQGALDEYVFTQQIRVLDLKTQTPHSQIAVETDGYRTHTDAEGNAWIIEQAMSPWITLASPDGAWTGQVQRTSQSEQVIYVDIALMSWVKTLQHLLQTHQYDQVYAQTSRSLRQTMSKEAFLSQFQQDLSSTDEKIILSSFPQVGYAEEAHDQMRYVIDEYRGSSLARQWVLSASQDGFQIEAWKN
jgi:hypothetical protein